VQITLSRTDLTDLHLLQYWNNQTGSWVIPPGTYAVSVGSSSQTTRTDHFTVRKG
jgi:beta-glucosidase